MKNFIFIFILINCTVTLLKAQPLVVLEPKGQTLVRRGFANEWQRCEAGTLLNEKDALRTEPHARATIKSNGSLVFQLPAKALVESQEIKAYTNSELVLLLTAMELSELAPQKSEMTRPSGAFVIHGAPQAERPESPIDSTAVSDYLEYEKNGLQALAAQGVWPGVILKVKKLEKYQAMKNSELLAYYFTVACHKLGLVRRFTEARKKYLIEFPNSSRAGEIQKLQ